MIFISQDKRTMRMNSDINSLKEDKSTPIANNAQFKFIIKAFACRDQEENFRSSDDEQWPVGTSWKRI